MTTFSITTQRQRIYELLKHLELDFETIKTYGKDLLQSIKMKMLKSRKRQ